MGDILTLLQCLQPDMTGTTLRQFSRIIAAMLSMNGRVTMRGLSRWAGAGGSYRTVQRFFTTTVPWATLFWLFFRQHVQRADQTYLLAGDEVVVSKAGKQTYGLDRFFASVYGKPIAGLAFFALSLVSLQERRAFPIRMEQVVRSDPEKAASQARVRSKAQPSQGSLAQRKPGRPKGSKNKAKAEVSLTPELLRIKTMLDALLKLIAGLLPVTYLVLDGHFGHHLALQMVQQCGLQLLSKLRCNSALYLPYAGAYSGHGRHRIYGVKLDYRHLPPHYLKQTTLEGQIETCLYQAQVLHKAFTQPLNVVVIVKTHLQTQACAHVILFSSDLTLAYDKLVDYYSLRFQIEFNFRDAKQFWGLEDFMNISETAVTNAANLSLFMVNLSQCLLRDLRTSLPTCSILDLKAHFHAAKYLDETLKLLPLKPEPVLLSQIRTKLASFAAIHPSHPSFTPP